MTWFDWMRGSWGKIAASVTRRMQVAHDKRNDDLFLRNPHVFRAARNVAGVNDVESDDTSARKRVTGCVGVYINEKTPD